VSNPKVAFTRTIDPISCRFFPGCVHVPSFHPDQPCVCNSRQPSDAVPQDSVCFPLILQPKLHHSPSHTQPTTIENSSAVSKSSEEHDLLLTFPRSLSFPSASIPPEAGAPIRSEAAHKRVSSMISEFIPPDVCIRICNGASFRNVSIKASVSAILSGSQLRVFLTFPEMANFVSSHANPGVYRKG
jgi:hypothetical protein